MAQQNIEKWINSLVSGCLTEFEAIGPSARFRGVYFSYFSYDSIAYTTIRVSGDDYTVEVGSGDDQHQNYALLDNVRGDVVDNFKDVAALANTGVDPKRVEGSKYRGQIEDSAFVPANTSPDIWPAPTEIGTREGFSRSPAARRTTIASPPRCAG